jgi:hypothetical protein
MKGTAQLLVIVTEMIRRLSIEGQVILADVSAAWQADLANETTDSELLNLRRHQLAADVILKALADAGL